MTKVRKKIGTIPINDIEQQVQQSTSAAITQMQRDVSDFIDEETAQYPEIGGTFKYIEDPEGRSEVVTDSEGKILSYRDSEGVIHENVGIALSESGMKDFYQTMKAKGFTGFVDWSDKKELHIPEPYCAIVNFTGINGMPQAKGVDMQGYMEFWDMQGNYFKKEVIMNAQGRGTMSRPKKNISIDICNNNGWDDDDTFKLQIGDWPSQDSFHIKAFDLDPFKCVCPITYKLYDEVVKTAGVRRDYVWKRALVNQSAITSTDNGASSFSDTETQFDTGARCFPLGFPCIVYLYGEFYGIFSWQLKKHRDVYHLSKNNKKHIHLDGQISPDSIFNANGDGSQIWWTEFDPEGFEIRNPKGLVYAEAHTDSKGKATYKYDADDPGCAEIAGNNDGSSTYDTWSAGSYLIGKIVTHNGHQFINTVAGNTKEPIIDSANDLNTDKSPDFKNKTKCGWINCTITVAVKKSIIELSTVLSKVNTAMSVYEASSKTAEDLTTLKSVIETYFDVDNIIEYLIVSDVINNLDGWRLNWQWFTYDAKKWYIGIYDCDNVMGVWDQNEPPIFAPRTDHFEIFPATFILDYYRNQLNARYKELRDANIISIEHIIKLLSDWLTRLGNVNALEKEWERWPESKKNDSLMRVEKWLEESFTNMDLVYDYNQN